MEIDEIPVGRAKDIRGQRIGHLIALYRVNTPEGLSKGVYWKCQCDCGKTTIVLGSNLYKNHTQSCGCITGKPINYQEMEEDEIPLGTAEDLRGKKIYNLTFLYRVAKPSSYKAKHYGSFWKCRCDCGNIIIVPANQVKNGHTKGCGCLNIGGSDRILEKPGTKYNKLTVLERANYEAEDTYWKCSCECGNITIVRGTDLRSGKVKSCGCLRGHSGINGFIDETGNRYGRLLVIERAKNKGKDTCWKCKCDCGNETIVRGTNLRDGSTLSCGCYHIDKCKKPKGPRIYNNYLTNEPDEIPLGEAENLRGKRFGKLIPLYRVKVESDQNCAFWKCQCDCGNTTITRSSALKSGKVASCGCSTESHGEIKIKELLLNNNLSFEQEYWFNDCRDVNPLRFDFYVNNLYLIEFDGKQHTEAIDYFGGEKGLQKTQQRDQIKNEYCKTHNIPLIRIPYWHYNDITIEDLKPETSQFLIT